MTDLNTATSDDGAVEVVFLAQVGEDPYHSDPQRDSQAMAVANRLVRFLGDARDGLAAEAAILKGSTNFTNDAWGLQENNVVILKSQDLSSYYATDFLQLWSRGKITDSTGYRDTGTAQVGRVPVTVAFTPGESATIVKDVVQAIEIARKRLVIAAMVMSSGARPGRRFRSD